MGPVVLKFPFEFNDLSGMNILIRKIWSGDFLRLEHSHFDWCWSLRLRWWYGYILLLVALLGLVPLLRYGIVIGTIKSPWRLSWMSNFQHGVRTCLLLFALLTEVIVVSEGTLVSNSDDWLHVTPITSDVPVDDDGLLVSFALPTKLRELFGLRLAVRPNLFFYLPLEFGEEFA